MSWHQYTNIHKAFHCFTQYVVNLFHDTYMPRSHWLRKDKWKISFLGLSHNSEQRKNKPMLS